MAQLIRISRGSLADIGQAMVNALISGADEQGAQVVVETIDPKTLESIALSALTAIAGKPVLTSDIVITVEADKIYPWLRRRYPS